MRTETGMSFAADYRWREKVRQETFNAMYCPFGREDISPKAEPAVAKPKEVMHPMPSSGSINFQRP